MSADDRAALRGGRVVDPPAERPVLVYDGDCAFCQSCVGLLRRRGGERTGYEPYQRLDARFAPIPRELFEETVVRVATDGTWTRSGEAVMLVLADGGVRWPLALYRRVPGISLLVELGYRVIARNRKLISRLFRKRCGIQG